MKLKSLENISRNRDERQTNKRMNSGENITSLVEATSKHL